MVARSNLVVVCSCLVAWISLTPAALGHDDEDQITRLIRLRRLTTALEDYQPTFVDRGDSVEVYRDDTTGITVSAKATGVRMGSLLNSFADKHESFDLSCIAVLRGVKGDKIEFFDGSDGLATLNHVVLLPGDMVVIMSPRADAP